MNTIGTYAATRLSAPYQNFYDQTTTAANHKHKTNNFDFVRIFGTPISLLDDFTKQDYRS
jgi:hypothetical protein